MSIKEIESAIEQLSPREVSELSVWLANHQASLWDTQIANDLDAARLDEILDQVDAEEKLNLCETFCPTSVLGSL